MVTHALISTLRTDCRVVAEGDSLTEGVLGNNELTYPFFAEDGVDGVRLWNMGNGGHTSTVMLTQVQQVIALKPELLFLWVGVNDILAGMTGVQVYANITDYVSQFKAALPGSQVALFNQPPFTPAAPVVPQATITAETDLLNAAIAANAAAADILIDIATDPVLQPNAAGKQGDNIHLSSVGAQHVGVTYARPHIVACAA